MQAIHLEFACMGFVLHPPSKYFKSRDQMNPTTSAVTAAPFFGRCRKNR